MANAYTVTKQEEIQQFGPDGVVVDAIRVTFKATASGQSAYVTVPVADYDAATVDGLIVPLVTKLNTVQAL